MTATLWLDADADEALSLGGTIQLYKTFQEMALLDGPGFEVRWPELFGVPYQVEDGDDADPDWMRDVVDQADRFLVKYASTLSGYSAGVLKVLVTRGREYLARRGAIAPNPVATAAVGNEGVVGAFLLDDEPAPDAEDGQANRPFAAAGAGTDHPGLTGNAADPDTDPNLLDIWEDADAWWWPEAVERLKQRALAFLAGDYYGQPGVVEEGRDRLEGFDNLMLDLGRVIDESLADPDVRDGALDMLVDAYLDGAEMAYRDAGPGGGKDQMREFVYGLVGNADPTPDTPYAANATPPRDVWGQFMSAKAKEMSDRLAAGWKVQAGAVSQGIANVVTKGIAAGKTAEEITADILDFSAGVPKARADVIARTEVTRAAAEGQLDAYGRLGVSELTADTSFELRTQGKNSCPDCVNLEKLGPMPIEKARGLIPVHPNCKCRWRVVRSVVGVRNDGDTTDLAELALIAANIFCPTGQGGGVDPTCKVGATRTPSTPPNPRLDRLHRERDQAVAEMRAAKSLLKNREWASKVKALDTQIAALGSGPQQAPTPKVPAVSPPAKTPVPSAPANPPATTPLGGQGVSTHEIMERVSKAVTQATVGMSSDSAEYVKTARVVRLAETLKIVKERARPDGHRQAPGMAKPEPVESMVVNGMKLSFAQGVSHEEVAKTLYNLASQQAPQKLYDSVKDVVMTTQRNSDDAIFARKLGRPNLMTTASAKDGVVAVYNGKEVRYDTLVHEAGHTFAESTWGTATPPRSSGYGKAQARTKPVSEYGATEPAEDFAEAVRMYATKAERGRLRREHPEKYQELEALLGPPEGGA